MNHLLSSLLFSLTVFTGYTQTKLIAHKSHSGVASTFFADGFDNFGRAPREFVMTSHLDSVIFVSDSVAVMVTSVCTRNQYNKAEPKTEKQWRPGRDTVYNHPLFTQQNQLDSIKNVLDQNYHFTNPMDSAVFIGFDNVKPKVKKTPGKTDKQVKSNGQKGSLYLLALLLAGMGGIYTLTPRRIKE